MRLQLYRNGSKFFFVTLTLAGRPQILSQVVEGEARPVLKPAGEAVKAVLLAVHALYPCATVSDFVIMPDHVHFLLIADYNLMPSFNPLWVAHRLMDAVEGVWNARGRPPNPQMPSPPCAPPFSVAVNGQGNWREKILCRGFGGRSHPFIPCHPCIPHDSTARPTSSFHLTRGS